LTTVRTDWMLGYQRRGVRRCECEIELPKPGRLPQMSQVAATGDSLDDVEKATGTGYPGGTQGPKLAVGGRFGWSGVRANLHARW
jgi:hypothetical protein